MKTLKTLFRIFLGMAGIFGLMLAYYFYPLTPKQELLTLVAKERLNYTDKIKNTKYTVLIDYDLPVFKKRLWVIDNESKEIVLYSRVSHAKKSGLLYATTFSNEVGSNISCTGAFVTGVPYTGKYGYSMKLHGLEKGKNDHTFQRAIVVHPHRSLFSNGCFMTKASINKQIVELTKGGAFFYVYKHREISENISQ